MDLIAIVQQAMIRTLINTRYVNLPPVVIVESTQESFQFQQLHPAKVTAMIQLQYARKIAH